MLLAKNHSDVEFLQVMYKILLFSKRGIINRQIYSVYVMYRYGKIIA